MRKAIGNIMVVILFFSSLTACYKSMTNKPMSSTMDQVRTEKSFRLIIDAWEQKSIPKTGDDSWWEASRSEDEWILSSKGDNIMVSQMAEVQGKFEPFRFDVKGGYFLGYNLGEFGGRFEFQNTNSSDTYQLYTGRLNNECNPIAVFMLEDEIFLLEGNSHLEVRDGRIYRIEKGESEWELGEFRILKGSPVAVLLDGNIAYIATDIAIFEVQRDQGKLSINELVEADFMYGLYPDSIVKRDNILYVGMRGGIFTFDLESKETAWLVKK